MDWNVYAVEQLVAMRIDEARARSAKAALIDSIGTRRIDTLTVLGLALIKLGRFVQRRGGVRRRIARAPALHMTGSRHV
jgi:hypothetical protein